jgi:hypothetical protein
MSHLHPTRINIFKDYYINDVVYLALHIGDVRFYYFGAAEIS